MKLKSISQNVNFLASKKNIPLSTLIEITYKCNHKCYYCYQKHYNSYKEIPYKKWCNILEQLSSAGTLYLTFSGGEPFLRNDFLKIVEYARKLKFGISIITNGTLLNKKIIKFLSDINILDIGISFHASYEHLHDFLCGINGGFNLARKNLEACLNAGIKTIIKHTVSSLNFGEFIKLKKLAKKTGALFECDCFVLPLEPLGCSPYSLSQTKFISFVKKTFLFKHPICITKNQIKEKLHCDAGRSVSGIRPNGDLLPCILLPIVFGNLLQKPFNEIWHSKIANTFRQKEKKLSSECIKCNMNKYCSRCHGIAFWESGNWRGKAKSLCLFANSVKSLKLFR